MYIGAVALLMACCVDEEETSYDAVATGEAATRAEITIPLSGSSSSSTDGDEEKTITTVDERRVNNLWLYAYKYDGSSSDYTLAKARYLDISQMGTMPDTTITAESDTTILNYTITTGTDGASDTTLTITTDIDEGMYLLYVVANAGEFTSGTSDGGTTKVLTGTETQTELEAVTITRDQLISESEEEEESESSSSGALVMTTKKRDVFVADGTTTAVDASMTFASAKVRFQVTFDPNDKTHITDEEGNLTSLTEYYSEAPTLEVDSIRMENISTQSTLVVASAEDAFKTDTVSVKLYDSKDTEASTIYSKSGDVITISGSMYLPERYVSETAYQTRLRIYGKMTMATGEVFENEVYTLVIGGDATGSTLTKASERQNLGTLARGNFYDIKAWLGYENEAYLQMIVSAKAFIEVEEEELTTDD